MDFNTLPEFLDHWADTCGDKIWLRDLREEGSDDYSWSAAREQVNAGAAAIEARFGNGNNMVLLSRNRPHWFMADLAIVRSGNVTVSMFTTLPPSTAQYIAGFTDAKVLFLGESPNWEAVRPVLPEGITIVTLPGVEIDGEHLTWEQLLEEGAGKMPQYECPFRRHDVARVHLRHHGTAEGGDTDPRQQHHSDPPLYPRLRSARGAALLFLPAPVAYRRAADCRVLIAVCLRRGELQRIPRNTAPRSAAHASAHVLSVRRVSGSSSSRR
jgi:hypothetical protein